MRLTLISLLALIVTFAFGQGYYPLSVGNRWEYHSTDTPLPPYSYLYTVAIISDTLMPNGHHYAVERGMYNNIRYLRQQGPLVFLLTQHGDSILYDFNVHSGDTLRVQYIHRFPEEPDDTLITTVSIASFEWFGRQRTIWRYSTFSADLQTVIVEDSFADSIGLIHSYWSFDSWSYCLGAIIDGVRLGYLTEVLNDFKAPASFILRPNYPNPFNPTTTIPYELVGAGKPSITVFDNLGHVLERIVPGYQEAGEHFILFNGSALSSGLYFYRLDVGEIHQTRSMMLVK